jgi:hypothetical protein
VKDKEDALKEIHLYTNMLLPNPESIFTANLNSFYRIDVYEFNEDATKYQRVISIVAITVVSAFLIGMTTWFADVY